MIEVDVICLLRITPTAREASSLAKPYDHAHNPRHHPTRAEAEKDACSEAVGTFLVQVAQVHNHWRQDPQAERRTHVAKHTREPAHILVVDRNNISFIHIGDGDELRTSFCRAVDVISLRVWIAEHEDGEVDVECDHRS